MSRRQGRGYFKRVAALFAICTTFVAIIGLTASNRGYGEKDFATELRPRSADLKNFSYSFYSTLKEAPRPESSTQYLIDIEGVGSLDRAERQEERLRSLGFDVELLLREGSARLTVGPFGSLQMARSELSRLQSLEPAVSKFIRIRKAPVTF